MQDRLRATLEAENWKIGWFGRYYPKIKQRTILAHLVRFSSNAPSRVRYNVKADEDLLFQVDRSHFLQI